jgi:hypothetical protein
MNGQDINFIEDGRISARAPIYHLSATEEAANTGFKSAAVGFGVDPLS